MLGIIELLVFILPAYIANSSPVLLGGGAKVDFGRAWGDGKRIFGDGKTWRGLFTGLLAGTLAGVVIAYSAPFELLAGILQKEFLYLPGMGSEPDFKIPFIALSFLLSLGTMVGDLAGSFAKRRIGMPPGRQFFLVDQLGFLVFALIFAIPVTVLGLDEILVLVVLTYILHVATNIFANRMGWKKVPW
ncbi:MAG: CDP-2,3-bis-(O-geranylgeranyl)-sn-glycerol synthase [Candidatus Micrarchaeota archaeon]|nr:CDP-2,3-bis-(O-geranylgeranyl)-sn-glycerol synthase [Candidatus Micrarchaeota archaeon]